MYPRILPRAAKDVVHIKTGRRVVTVTLPPRESAGSEVNYERVAIMGKALRRAALDARDMDAAAKDQVATELLPRTVKAPRARRPAKKT